MSTPINPAVYTDVAITGISCRLPQSDNMNELWENLVNGVDMVTENDLFWPKNLHGLPARTGVLKNLDRFDPLFFEIGPKQNAVYDFEHRKVLEVVHEAILDSGVDPKSLSGRKCGVLVGSEGGSGVASEYYSDTATISGFETKNHGSMMSNYISFFYDLKGPSMTLNSACSSSFQALRLGYRYMLDNQCDMFLVVGSHCQYSPQGNLTLNRAMMLAPDGKCKVFDDSADGYVRSDGVVAILLQRTNEAKRIYGHVKGVWDNCDGKKSQGTSFPSAESQKQLLEDFYTNLNISPDVVKYVESHGTGTQAGDKAECNALSAVFCKNGRKDLLVGSVKSNLGHTETVSGLASLCKVLLSWQHKLIPGNIHLENFNTNIPELFDGSLKIVRENMPIEPDCVAINSFGFGGAKVHTVVEPYKELKNEILNSNLEFTKVNEMRLALMCGRSEDGTMEFLEKFHLHKNDLEFQYLTENLAKSSPVLYPYRGFTILNANGSSITKVENVKDKSDDKPIAFIYNGMGAQWAGMAKELMNVDLFSKSIDKCHEALIDVGFDLKNTLENYNEEDAQDLVKCLVCITSIQVAFTDILHCYKIEPSYIIGHSHGEYGCAYADKALTAQQAVLCAFWKATSIVENVQVEGIMAAVIGITTEDLEKHLTPSVVLACRNSETIQTVSGPKADMEEFLNKMNQNGIKNKIVKSCNKAFHHHSLQPCVSKLIAKYSKVIENPKARSSKWISSCFPENEFETEAAQFASTEYFLGNLLNQVYFHEAILKLPENCVVVEIGPNTLLQGLIKGTLGANATFCPMMTKGDWNLEFILKALGSLYIAGINIDQFYNMPKINYPVRLEAPMISPYFKWDHSQVYPIPKACTDDVLKPYDEERLSIIKYLYVAKDSWLRSHQIDGRLVIPATYYLELLLDVYCSFKNLVKESPKLTFQIKEWLILKAVFIPQEEYIPIRFQVTICRMNGYFEIYEGDSALVTGFITHKVSYKNYFKNVVHHKVIVPMREAKRAGKPYIDENDSSAYKKNEIYQFVNRAGYEYGEKLQLIEIGRKDQCIIKWNGILGAFLDGINQYQAFRNDIDTIYIPYVYNGVHIDLYELIHIRKVGDLILSELNDKKDYLLSAGIKMTGKRSERIQMRAPDQNPVYQMPCNVKYFNEFQDDELKAYINKCSESIDIFQKSDVQINEDNNEKFVFTKLLADLKATGRKKIDINKMAILKDDFLLSNLISSSDMLEYFSIMDQNIHSQTKTVVHLSSNSLWNNTLILNMAELIQFQLMTVMTDDLNNGNMKRLPLFIKSNKEEIAERDNFMIFSSGIFSDADQNLDEKLKFVHDILLNNGGFFCFHDINLDINLFNKITEFFKNSNADGKLNYKPVNMKHIKQKLMEHNFNICYEKSNSISSVFIGRPNKQPIALEPEQNKNLVKIISMDDNMEYSWFHELKESLAKIENPNQRIWLVAEVSQPNGIIGLVNCLKLEENGECLRIFYNFSSNDHSLPDEYKSPNGKKFKEIVEKDMYLNGYSNGEIFTCIHRDYKKSNKDDKLPDNFALCQRQDGNMSTFYWAQLPDFLVDEDMAKQHGMEEVTICYSSLNFRDVVVATGRLKEQKARVGIKALENKIGSEFSGITKDGTRVMGIGAKMTAMATKVIAKSDMMWTVPDNMTLKEAATIPMVYFTAYFSLVVKAKITSKDIVLIHSATSAVGQAAIRICKKYKCKIFCTVGNKKKIQFLSDEFQIPKKHIFNSRSTEFVQKILALTEGTGVQVILNSLSDEKLLASFSLLGTRGRFLEIGKNDMAKNSKIGMSQFLEGTAFFGIVLETVLGQDNEEFHQVRQLIYDGMKDGTVKPLNTYTYRMDEVENAFRLMSSGTHIGKILLQIRQEESVNSALNYDPNEFIFKEKLFCKPDLVYVITGGLGGLGNELSKALLNRYAWKIVVTTRSKNISGYRKKLLDLLKNMEGDLQLKICNYDVSDYDQAVKLFDEAETMGKIGGIFHLAGVLHDAHFQNQTIESFKSVADIKVKGTYNLDKISRERYPKFEDSPAFYVFSSIAGAFGNASQSPYGYGNYYADLICQKRCSDGFTRSTSIQWGPMAEVGMYEETLHIKKKMLHAKGIDVNTMPEMMDTGIFEPQRMNSFFDTFELFNLHPQPVVTSFVISTPMLMASQGRNDYELGLQSIEKVLGVKDLSNLKEDTKLSQLGLDSIMTSEIHIILRTRLGMEIGPNDVKALSIGDLLKYREVDDD